jgi:hypothetical protein
VLAATVPLPALDTPVTLPVSDANAPAHLPASCADQFGDDACTMSLSWSGNVTITPACATVSLSAGGAAPVGTAVAIGQTIRTGKGQRLELTLGDGSLVRLGPESAVVCQTGAAVGGKRKLTMRLLLGTIWAAVSDALGVSTEFVPEGRPGGTGVRGSEFTLSLHGKGDPIAHVVEGTGFVKYPGKPEFDYPAGLSAAIGKKSAKLTSRWPAADRALVPKADQPPRLSAVKLKGRKLSFKLDRPSSVLIQVVRGKKIVAKKKLHARKGRSSTRAFKRLRKGRYRLRVTATANTRSTAALVSFKA